MNNYVDWKQHYHDYCQFLQWYDVTPQDIEEMTQLYARSSLKRAIEYTIEMNGYSTLYAQERYYAKLLGLNGEL